MNVDAATIPRDFDHAVELLYTALEAGDVGEILSFATPSEASIATHHDLGRAIRNMWIHSMAKPVALVEDARHRFGLAHADDISGLLLSALAHRVFNIEHPIDDEVRHYLNHWKTYDCNPDGSPR